MASQYKWALGVVILAVVGVPVAYVLDSPGVAMTAAALPGAVAALVVLDLHRRTRDRHRKTVEWEKKVDRRLGALTKFGQHGSPARAATLTQEDLLGAVQVLGARYEARLDRAQATLEEATRALQATDRSGSRELPEGEQPDSGSRRLG